MGTYLNPDESVTDDDVEGHGVWQNANEPVTEDDMEGHGLEEGLTLEERALGSEPR